MSAARQHITKDKCSAFPRCFPHSRFPPAEPQLRNAQNHSRKSRCRNACRSFPSGFACGTPCCLRRLQPCSLTPAGFLLCAPECRGGIRPFPAAVLTDSLSNRAPRLEAVQKRGTCGCFHRRLGIPSLLPLQCFPLHARKIHRQDL